MNIRAYRYNSKHLRFKGRKPNYDNEKDRQEFVLVHETIRKMHTNDVPGKLGEKHKMASLEFYLRRNDGKISVLMGKQAQPRIQARFPLFIGK